MALAVFALRKAIWFAIQVLLGVAMLAVLLYFADIGKVVSAISQADILYLAMATFAFISASVVVGYSLYVLLERMGYSPSALRTVLVSIAGQLVSDITPARTGYFVTPLIMSGQLGVTLEDGMAAIVFTGAVQAFASVVLGAIAILYFSRLIASGLEVVLLAVIGLVPVALMGLGLFSLIHHSWLNWLLHSIREVPFVKPRLEQIRQAISTFQKSGRRATSAAVQVIFFLLVAQGLNSVALYLLSLSVGIHGLTVFDCVMTYSIAGFTMYAFLTVAGLGVQESMYVILLGLLKASVEKATAVAMMARFFFTVTDLIGLPELTKMGVRTTIRALSNGQSTPA